MNRTNDDETGNKLAAIEFLTKKRNHETESERQEPKEVVK